jgi:DNA-binding GntR family transcriptional regulator
VSESIQIPSGALAQVRRVTFRAHVADHLRQAIIRGDIAPGTPVTEAELARHFAVSRGPLREAMRQLVEEGLLVSVPYTGTRVINLRVDDVREIYSLRSTLETLAFQQIWLRRDCAFHTEIERRHIALVKTLTHADTFASTTAEMQLHALVYEACGHRLLLDTWQRIAGRLQLYLAVHQRAHNRKAPLKDAHERYVRLAQGNRLDLMIAEVEHHMRRGVEQLEQYVGRQARQKPPQKPDTKMLVRRRTPIR